MFDGWDLTAEPPPAQRDFQAIVVGGRSFAVPNDAVRWSMAATGATPVPGSHPHLRGVVMWKGQVVPVVATCDRLALTLTRVSKQAVFLGLEVGGESFFLEVDAIGQVIAGNRVDPGLPGESMVVGFVESSGEEVPVLDLDALTDFGHRGGRA